MTLKLTTALLACALLAACTPSSNPPPVAAPATAPATAPAAPATAGIEGRYSGMLPCADCEGLDTTLVLTADNNYKLTQLYHDKDNSSFISDGSFSLESEGNIVHLHPANKDEYDGYYAVLSPTQLRMLDREGKAIESELNYTLTKQ